MRTTITLLLLSIGSLNSQAQIEYLQSVPQQPSGGVNICASEDAGAFLVLSRNQGVQPPLVKLDMWGDTVWVKFPFQMIPALGKNIHLKDNHLFVVGQGRIYKLTLDGDVVWDRTITVDEISTDNGDWMSVVLADGSVVVSRTAINPSNLNPSVSNHYRPIIVRVSSEGDLLWTAEHRFETSERILSIASDGNGSLLMGGRGIIMHISEASGELESAYRVAGEFGEPSTVFLTSIEIQADGVRYWGAVSSGPLNSLPAIATFLMDNDGNPSAWDYYAIEQGGVFTANAQVVTRSDGSRIVTSGRVLAVIGANGALIAASTSDFGPNGGNTIALSLADDVAVLLTGTMGSPQSPNAFYARVLPGMSSLCEVNAFSLSRITGGISGLTSETSTFASLGSLALNPVFPLPPPGPLPISDPCVTVGMETEQETGSFAVHPNPASSSIILNTGILRGKGSASITDMTGRLVQSLSLSSSQTAIDISGLRSGMYLLHFSDEKSTGTVRFVKE